VVATLGCLQPIVRGVGEQRERRGRCIEEETEDWLELGWRQAGQRAWRRQGRDDGGHVARYNTNGTVGTLAETD
jgi:hypothetical protein